MELPHWAHAVFNHPRILLYRRYRFVNNGSSAAGFFPSPSVRNLLLLRCRPELPNSTECTAVFRLPDRSKRTTVVTVFPVIGQKDSLDHSGCCRQCWAAYCSGSSHWCLVQG